MVLWRILDCPPGFSFSAQTKGVPGIQAVTRGRGGGGFMGP